MIRIRGLRWWMISLIMLGSVMNYLTRSTLAVAAPTVLHELRISEREYSWIVGAFQGAIMTQPVCGYVLDVLGLKIGFAIFAVTWSLVNMTDALANSWQTLAWLRGRCPVLALRSSMVALTFYRSKPVVSAAMPKARIRGGDGPNDD